MQISSVRLGFANNSSSSHSILLGARPEAPRVSAGSYEFGWEYFYLTDAPSKEEYITAMAFHALRNEGVEEAMAAATLADITGNPDIIRHIADGGYVSVDHQSMLCFPRDRDGRVLRDFIADFVEYVRRDDVTILGGNDNSEPPPWAERLGGTQVMKELDDYGDMKGRKDGDWWVLFNCRSGGKIRLSFARQPAPYLRASMPELVDLKITDYCPHGCSFCYQGSTRAGGHASMRDIDEALTAIALNGAFEVAIGGGEPTAHPEFVDIIRLAADLGLVPNFTTFNMNWVNRPALVAAVNECCGSFAVSSYDDRTLEAMRDWNNQRSWPKKTATLQLTEGTMPLTKFASIIAKAKELRIPVTILGYKTTGRGSRFRPYEWSGFVDVLSDARLDRFGADSVIVQRYNSNLQYGYGVHPVYMVSAEGAFTMYVDAVEQKAGPSSFCDGSAMEAYEHGGLSDLIAERFPYAGLPTD